VKTIKVNFVQIMAIIFVIFSSGCQKDEINQVQNGERYYLSLGDRLFTDSQIDSIAIYHNIYMTEVIENFDIPVDNYEDELTHEFLEIANENSTANEQEMLEFLDSCEIDNYNFVVSNTDDDDVKLILDNVKDYIENTNNLTFSQIQNYINSQKNFANENVSGGELDVILSFLSTTEKSCYLWMPTEFGGSGVGAGFIEDLEDEIGCQVNWRQIGYADGAGAAGVLLRTWYLAGFGPLSWSAIVGAIGWGAAWGSGTALLYQLM
jgi:hypothetical protein